MKAYLFHRPGPPESLRISEVPHPGPPAPGHLLLRVRAIGLNYAEVLSRKGQYSWAPKRPYIPGMEVVGEVGQSCCADLGCWEGQIRPPIRLGHHHAGAGNRACQETDKETAAAPATGWLGHGGVRSWS